MKATAKDLRFHTKELIDSVSRGEEVVITFRGKPCAKLVPYQEPKDRRRNKITFFSPVRICQIAIDFSGRSENKSRIRDMR